MVQSGLFELVPVKSVWIWAVGLVLEEVLDLGAKAVAKSAPSQTIFHPPHYSCHPLILLSSSLPGC